MSAGGDDIVDLGAADIGCTSDASSVDFSFDDDEATVDLEATAESPTLDQDPMEKTAEMPAPMVETPTIEEQFDGFGDEGTSELPSLDMDLGRGHFGQWPGCR